MDRQSLISTQIQLADAHEAEAAQHLVNAGIYQAAGQEDAAELSRQSAAVCIANAQARRAVAASLKAEKSDRVDLDSLEAVAQEAAAGTL